MTAWAYSLVYNEALLIPYWVRYYRTFCERVIVYVDTDTTDDTISLVEANGGEARQYIGNGTMDDIAFVDFANNRYREAIGKADWVIWTDADEWLYHPDPARHLAELHAAGVTLPYSRQYVMASPGPPAHAGQLFDHPDFRKGYRIPEGGKMAIFDPNKLDVLWQLGKHGGVVNGPIVRDPDSDDAFKLLHYRWLGEDYLHARDARNYGRLPDRSRASGMGYHTYPGFTGPYDSGWPADARPADAQNVLDA